MSEEQQYYYILFIDDRTGGEEVSLYRSKIFALRARDEFVQARMFMSGAPTKLEGYPDYIGGWCYEYSGDGYDGVSSEDSGSACVYRVEIKEG
jgi:hypothetical protein